MPADETTYKFAFMFDEPSGDMGMMVNLLGADSSNPGLTGGNEIAITAYATPFIDNAAKLIAPTQPAAPTEPNDPLGAASLIVGVATSLAVAAVSLDRKSVV